jgi:hypothetical protein
MSAWTCRHPDGKTAPKIVPPRPRIPYWNGLGADSEEKREPVSDIDTAVVDSLKVLDLKWPIREADVTEGWSACSRYVDCPANMCLYTATVTLSSVFPSFEIGNRAVLVNSIPT